MNISGPIRAIIANDTTANTALQNRVYPGIFPIQYSLPAVAINITMVQPNATKTGPGDVDAVIVQVDCYADSYSLANNIAKILRDVLDYFRGDVLMGGELISIDWVDYEGQTDAFEEKPREYRVSCDYSVRMKRVGTVGSYDGELVIPSGVNFIQVYGPYVDDDAAIADGLVAGQLYTVAAGNDAIPAGTIKKIGTPIGSNFIQVFGPYVDDATAIANGLVNGQLYIVAPGNDSIPAGIIKQIGTP